MKRSCDFLELCVWVGGVCVHVRVCVHGWLVCVIVLDQALVYAWSLNQQGSRQ